MTIERFDKKDNRFDEFIAPVLRPKLSGQPDPSFIL